MDVCKCPDASPDCPLEAVGSERKRSEAQISILAREAEHRAKNLLANVEAMVRLSNSDTRSEQSLNNQRFSLPRLLSAKRSTSLPIIPSPLDSTIEASHRNCSLLSRNAFSVSLRSIRYAACRASTSNGCSSRSVGRCGLRQWVEIMPSRRQ
jgi:hypothetical protein